MALSDDAVAAISALRRRDHAGACMVRIRSVSAGIVPTVQLEGDAVHRERDVTVSRGGASVFIDREIAAATADNGLDVQPHPDDDRPLFLLQDQPGSATAWPI